MPRPVPEQQPRYTVPKDSSLPAWNLILRDGRVLRYRNKRLPDGKVIRGADGQVHNPADYVGTAPKLTSAALSCWQGDDGMLVTASLSDTKFGTFLQVVVSYADHDPSWTDIKLVRAAFYPDRASVAMMLPPASVYVNIHAHCFQLYEIPVDWTRASEAGPQIDPDGRVLRSRRLAKPRQR